MEQAGAGAGLAACRIRHRRMAAGGEGMKKDPRKQLREALGRYRASAMVGAIVAALYEGADMIRSEAHRSISAGSVSGKGHKPSAPGEAPNRDTGTLQAHIEVSMPEPPSEGTIVARVTSSAPYAAALEFGTSKMAARPYLRPARDKVAPDVGRILKQRLERAKKVY